MESEKDLTKFLEKHFSKELKAIKNQEEAYEWSTACSVVCTVVDMVTSYIYEISGMYIDEHDIFDYIKEGAW